MSSGSTTVNFIVNDAELQSARDVLDAVLEKKAQLTECNSSVDESAEKLRGMEQAGARVTRMLPGLREAERLNKSLEKLSEGNILGLIGVYGLIMNVLQRLVRMEEEQKRKQKELERDVMQNQNFTTKEQYTTWETQQKTALNASRNIGR